MGARLQYAKVVDRADFYVRERGRIHPGLDNRIVVDGEPGKAGAFLVLRAWTDDHGTFTEQWRIEGPQGKLYESAPREIHVANTSHVEKIEDEITDLEFDFAGDGYSVVFELDEREVARVDFEVKLNGGAGEG